MSSFFTLAASQKKRKRAQPTRKADNGFRQTHRKDDDAESISGSELSDENAPASRSPETDRESDESDDEDENPAAKRLRLAEQYLANTQKQVLEDGAFDAAEVDKENLQRRMGERLKEDTAESKGKLYRWMADGLHWQRAEKTVLRCNSVKKTITGVAMREQYVYGVSKNLDLIKWHLPESRIPQKGRRLQKRPNIVAHTRGNRKAVKEQHHYKQILCIAVSPDGKFVATGGADKKLIVWDANTLKPLKVFYQHRDAVTALAFRRGTNQLFSASKDRTIKTWSLDELAYVETLFGHQDEVVDVSALAEEKCVSAGARDRTARLWKVVEESQLVFRGGGAPGTSKALETLKRAYDSGLETQEPDEQKFHEGSTDRIAMVDNETFVTASDNGSLSLWNIHKKKAVYTLPLAHGVDPALPLDKSSAEQEPEETLNERSRGGKQPRWVTSLRSLPFSDVLLTGSWDGYVRAWKITQDKRRIEPLGAVGAIEHSVESLLASEGLTSDSMSNAALQAMRVGTEKQGPTRGIINDIAVVDSGDRGADGVLIAAAFGKEHRFGRWKEVADGKNAVVLFRVPKMGAAVDLQSDVEEPSIAAAQEDKLDGFG